MKQNKRLYLDITALASTIIVNCLITSLVGDIETMGLVIAPLIGGIGRSLIANKKDVPLIIVGMLVLDIVLFVPMIITITHYSNWYTGMLFGVVAGGFQAVVGFVTLGLRYLTIYLIKKYKENPNQKNDCSHSDTDIISENFTKLQRDESEEK